MNDIMEHVRRFSQAYIVDKLDDILPADIDTMMEELPQWRRDEALSFKHQQGRKECVLSFYLLKQILKKDFNIEDELVFEYGEHGKPSLKNHSGIHFNIGHCRPAVAVVVDKKPVGIDIERRGRYSEVLARHVLSEAEMDCVQGSDDVDLQFTKFWTQKEALLKLTGEGISGNMKDVLHDCSKVRFSTLVEEQYVCTLAEWL